MSLYEQFKNEKKKTSGNLYQQFLDSKPKQKADKEPITLKGILSGAKNVANEVAKSVVRLPARYATNVINAGQIVAGKEQTKPLSNKWLGEVSAVGQGEDFGEQLKDTYGAGLELASYLPFGRAAKVGYQAIKQPTKEVLKRAALEGSVGGAVGTLGNEMQRSVESNEPVSYKNVAIGAGAGAVLGPALSIIGMGARRFVKGKERTLPVTSEADDSAINVFRQRNLGVEGTNVTNDIPVGTPKTRQTDYAKRMGYEPYVPESELPVINLGRKEASDLPTIQTTPRTSNKKGELSYVPEVARTIVNEGKASRKTSETIQRSLPSLPKRETPPLEPITTVQDIPRTETVDTTPFQGTGETKVRGLSQGVESKAVESKLTNRFGDLPEYRTVNMKDQASRASRLLAEDEDFANRIARGTERAPDDVIPEAVFTAVENKAIKDGNVDLLRELSSSRLTTDATTMGQRIRTLAERNPDTPVTAIKSLSRAREEVAEARMGKEKFAVEKKRIRSEIKKELAVKADKQEWVGFIESLTC